MANKRGKKSSISSSQLSARLNDIYNRFQAKASAIGAKNFQAFESAVKKIDYLEINAILHQLSQLKVLGR